MSDKLKIIEDEIPGPYKFWVVWCKSRNFHDETRHRSFAEAKMNADEQAERQPGLTFYVACVTYQVIAKNTPILHETELS
jgi:hypothetical protein